MIFIIIVSFSEQVSNKSFSGGEEVLIDCGGIDATTAFEDVGHSDDAVEALEPLFVGLADAADFKTPGAKTGSKSSSGSSSESGSSSVTYLIIAAIVAAAAFFYLQTKK